MTVSFCIENFSSFNTKITRATTWYNQKKKKKKKNQVLKTNLRHGPRIEKAHRESMKYTTVI